MQIFSHAWLHGIYISSEKQAVFIVRPNKVKKMFLPLSGPPACLVIFCQAITHRQMGKQS